MLSKRVVSRLSSSATSTTPVVVARELTFSSSSPWLVRTSIWNQVIGTNHATREYSKIYQSNYGRMILNPNGVIHRNIFMSSINSLKNSPNKHCIGKREFSTATIFLQDEQSNLEKLGETRPKKVLLVDGTPLVVRAYHGTPPLSTSTGIPTNAVLTYVKSLVNILQSDHYDYVGVFFDSGKPSVRKSISPDYKATRKPTDDLLKKQFPICKLLTEKIGIKVISMDGFEADDLIATMTREARELDHSVVVVSSDKDLHCLVDEQTVMLDPMTKKTISMDDIIDKYSLPPKLIPDYLALVGDTADNIKGVKGIGKKKAVALLEQFISVDDIINNIDKIPDKKSRDAILQHLDDLKLSLQLVQLDEHVSLPYSLDDLRLDSSALKLASNHDFVKQLEELEMNSILRLIQKKSKTEVLNSATNSSTDTASEKKSKGRKKAAVETMTLSNTMTSADLDLVKQNYAESDSTIGKITKECEYNIILNEKELDNLINDIKSCGYVSFSTEVCLLSMHNPVLAGMTFCLQKGVAYYVPFFKNGKVEFKESIELLAQNTMWQKIKTEIMENSNILKIGHDLKRHIKALAHYGVSINKFDDIMVMSYVLNCGKHGHEMDELVEHILEKNPKEYLIPEKEVLGIGKKKVTLLEADIVAVVHYTCQHSDVTKQIYDILKPELQQLPKLTQLYETIERPLVETLAAIEMKGVFMDEEALDRMEVEYKEKIKDVGNKIREAAGYTAIDHIEISTEEEVAEILSNMEEGEKFNINSNRQLGQVIFDKLGIGGKYKKKTKLGDYILNAEVLEKLAEEGHAIAKYILEYRALTKLYSTYIYGLKQHINPYTKRIHTTFQNALTVTGRLSSVMPNIQNIPVRTKEGKQIRRCFIAPSDDYVIMKVDYSQVELRILAHLARIDVLKEAFKNGADVHAITASQVFNVPIDKVDKATRNKAKAINFGIIYGMSEFGLSKRIGVDKQTAKAFIEQYFQQYPGIKKYMENTKDFCRTRGYVNTLYHRRCWIPGINDAGNNAGFAERTSINTPIQGTSADITKIAMNSLHKAFLEKGLRTRMIIQVHDEIVFEVPKDEVEIVQPMIVELMEGAPYFNGTSFSVPLTVEVSIDSKWLADE
ncbi:hypothetical protein FDP41_000076 [Naegleria fowleri]|uniref:DNA-directed DNA polymerase n=1 Tax=Naegleria fowleri TaxID=5763 RepID=A0A6A5C6W2_NAEFO|nr:uncharacterized protein FDP41_000076 [Naegleria fowleri]KAF0985037.1 hypothetical protein FDP41_000076 [Naegleria fowleri]